LQVPRLDFEFLNGLFQRSNLALDFPKVISFVEAFLFSLFVVGGRWVYVAIPGIVVGVGDDERRGVIGKSAGVIFDDAVPLEDEQVVSDFVGEVAIVADDDEDSFELVLEVAFECGERVEVEIFGLFV